MSQKKEHASLSIHLEMNGLEVQHELAVAAALFRAQACWFGKLHEDMYMVSKRHNFQAQTWSSFAGFRERCVVK